MSFLVDWWDERKRLPLKLGAPPPFVPPNLIGSNILGYAHAVMHEPWARTMIQLRHVNGVYR